MCGIVGAVAVNDITTILTDGLSRLEYRGYDSCGIAVYANGELHRTRTTERVSELVELINEAKITGLTGIAHTRWATHGAPTTNNAHPHFSRHEDQTYPNIALVHNGIIENHDELKSMLIEKGFEFESQTDTEVIVHLINYLYVDDLLCAVQQATGYLKGAYALAVMSRAEPHRIIGARHGSPLVLGLPADPNHISGHYLASDALALTGITDQIIYLEDGDIVDIQTNKYWVFDSTGSQIQRTIHTVHSQSVNTDLGPYRHFMQKEIFEQPRAVADTLHDIDSIEPELFGLLARKRFMEIDSILILACGTSYYSGLTAKYWLESIAKIRVEVEIASEYRYRESVPNPNTLIITLSQSGETADTLAALKHAQTLGMHKTMTICNVSTSAMVRECELAYITRAGVEIGVASTKAFTTQLTALYLLTLVLAKLKNLLSQEDEAEALKNLKHLPVAMQDVLNLEPQIKKWAEKFAQKEHALFLGRGMHYPIALEGALKLKEISYIHAEAYPAGELKHGPLALVTNQIPVVVVAPTDQLLEKLKSNMSEVKARGGELFVFSDNAGKIEQSSGMHVIRLPGVYGDLSPILHTLPLQLLAYHVACVRGTDVDKPRNLAKSVTVE
ncbi:glutamine--fructose-6-phosphate transaminase (isomerizing) [Thorsellia anophelis]|uniref:Glutamine--fructose-6-phosphate aminotransferase [isomerizing] n=1 Tax=Thorsellia anophelis DSM 18579 TaxID=1123402 RepID=A0A1I0EIC4_9GAMM|nr:glutamine--fructose-6-phosphate transaminase (isomerizing) [Thorsellia anophelis]SET44193.1 glutamine--fructose-6-phosphate transaminase [Thorsellia anophelis DSM 18579]